MVFFVLTAALSGTFSNLLIPLQIGARDMTREHDFILVVFHLKCNYDWFTFVEAGPASSGWTIYPPLSALPQAIPGSGMG
jgi:cytochrome c oxidase subunit 1